MIASREQQAAAVSRLHLATRGVDDDSKTQLGETIERRGEERPRHFLQRLQGVRGTAIYGHEDRPKSQVELRSRRVEGKENNARPMADRICGDQAPCRTRSGRIRRSGWYRVPL